MKVARTLLASLAFLVLLVVIYYLHVHYFPVDVVFYAAIADGILATSIAAFGLLYLKAFRVLGSFEKFLVIVTWLLVSYALAISVPAVIDRSLSFYILEKLQQRGGGIRQDAIEQVFTQEYIKEHRLVDVRLTEQLVSGTIEIKNGCVLLTPKGNVIAELSRYFRKNWLPSKRLLLGQYTDDLTDPFRKSTEVVGYRCD